jgi:GNAT superfamily N-acetyltransferase
VELYRSLYDAVGRPWHWVDRKRLSDDELARILGDPAVEVHVLRVGGEPAGYAELDRRVAGEIELAYFGLMPAFVGQGLGGYFLRWAVARAWSYAPRRVWVHTCTLDHPSALPCYLRAGFREYARAVHGAHVDDGQP